jgi:hypothetical protein
MYRYRYDSFELLTLCYTSAFPALLFLFTKLNILVHCDSRKRATRNLSYSPSSSLALEIVRACAGADIGSHHDDSMLNTSVFTGNVILRNKKRIIEMGQCQKQVATVFGSCMCARIDHM